MMKNIYCFARSTTNFYAENVISETHRECKEISTFEDVVLNAKKSVAFTEIESSLQELKENMSLILEDRQKNLSTISVSKEKLQSEISTFRQQINHHLDEIQDHFIAELNKAVENSTQQIKNFIAELEEKKREIDACIEDVEIIKNHATDLQTFLGTKDEETATFGKSIVEVQPCKLSLQRRKEGQAQLMKVDQEPKRLVEHITLELKAKFDTTATNVSGCCILPCGKLVVSNYSPSYLTLFTSDGKFEKRIVDIMSCIHDVTCVDNDTVAVISATERNIQLVSLKSGKIFRSINTNFCSVGITYKEGKFIVCPDDDHVMQAVWLEDNKSSTFGISVFATHVTHLGNKLYTIDRDTNRIFCLNRNGDIQWTFADLTVLSDPTCITVDEHGNVFVANTENVFVISYDGKHYKILLSDKELCSSPWAICYNSELKSLLVANESDGQAFLYNVKYT
ncbi:unnamed protein product [Mytilus edulis]|uniref:Uncharacterized protein n=1 Tax=Mytilus edulis TaxID=6550 RepID=A0A8S3RAG1_MYTED|nr:unnamed protein product [Mytilus edulis]